MMRSTTIRSHDELTREVDALTAELERERAERTRLEGVLAAIEATSVSLTSQRDVDPILREILARCAVIAHTPHAFISVVTTEDDEQVLRVRVGIGLWSDYLGWRSGRGQGVSGAVWDTGAALVIEDYQAWPGRASFVKQPIRSMIALPICRGEDVLGVLSAATTTGRYAQDDVALLSGLAKLTAVALDNARLCGALEAELAVRRRDEAQLRRARQDAEAASRAKSEFLASMSHEIRTPLNGVLGMIELLLDSPLDPDQTECANMARRSGLHLLDLLNDILDLSRIEADKLTLDPTPFNLRATIEDVAEQAAIGLDPTVLQVIARYVPGTPERVIGDAGRIRQLVVNLVHNAVKFTSAGHVLITVQSTQGHATVAHIKISVEDTGIGISRADQGRIFEQFGQVDSTAKGAGAGLGLAIVRRLVDKMGGALGVDSEPGQGTTFWFSLPLELEPAAAAPPRPHPPMSQLRVLVVDAHPINRMLVLEQIGRWNMIGSGCLTGARALTELREARERGAPYDMALIDFELADMTGAELAGHIKRDDRIAATALVLAISAANQLTARKYTDCGFAGQVIKPLRRAKLTTALTEAWQAQRGPALAAPPRPERDPAPHGGERPLRVLLAEDNLINQKVASRMLTRIGCAVTVARDGREAVMLAQASSFDLILMDVQMPGMDGFEATAAIREREASTGRRTPIIAMTAHAMLGYRERCLAADMDDYISKPILREAMIALVDKFAGALRTQAP